MAMSTNFPETMKLLGTFETKVSDVLVTIRNKGRYDLFFVHAKSGSHDGWLDLTRDELMARLPVGWSVVDPLGYGRCALSYTPPPRLVRVLVELEWTTDNTLVDVERWVRDAVSEVCGDVSVKNVEVKS